MPVSPPSFDPTRTNVLKGPSAKRLERSIIERTPLAGPGLLQRETPRGVELRTDPAIHREAFELYTKKTATGWRLHVHKGVILAFDGEDEFAFHEPQLLGKSILTDTPSVGISADRDVFVVSEWVEGDERMMALDSVTIRTASPGETPDGVSECGLATLLGTVRFTGGIPAVVNFWWDVQSWLRPPIDCEPADSSSSESSESDGASSSSDSSQDESSSQDDSDDGDGSDGDGDASSESDSGSDDPCGLLCVTGTPGGEGDGEYTRSPSQPNGWNGPNGYNITHTAAPDYTLYDGGLGIIGSKPDGPTPAGNYGGGIEVTCGPCSDGSDSVSEPSSDGPSGDPSGGDPSGGDPSSDGPSGDPSGGDPSGGDPSGGDPSGGDPSDGPSGDPSGGDPSGGDPSGGGPSGSKTAILRVNIGGLLQYLGMMTYEEPVARFGDTLRVEIDPRLDTGVAQIDPRIFAMVEPGTLETVSAVSQDTPALLSARVIERAEGASVLVRCHTLPGLPPPSKVNVKFQGTRLGHSQEYPPFTAAQWRSNLAWYAAAHQPAKPTP